MWLKKLYLYKLNIKILSKEFKMPAMSLKEYDKLVDYIDKNHGINNPQRNIKN